MAVWLEAAEQRLVAADPVQLRSVTSAFEQPAAAAVVQQMSPAAAAQFVAAAAAVLTVVADYLPCLQYHLLPPPVFQTE